MLNITKRSKEFSHKKLLGNQRHKLLFYILMSIVPVLHFCVFYIYIDLQSIILAFQKYEIVGGKYAIGFSLDNFVVAFKAIGENWFMVKNSLLAWFINTIFTYPIALFFAYYILKKRPMGSFFKVTIFAPTIISELIMAMLFKYMSNYMYPAIVEIWTGEKVPGLLAINSLDTHFVTVVAFSIWMGIGLRMLMFLSAMGNINDSVLEAAKLDGASDLQEFFYIILPLIYSTLTSFLIIGVTGLFTNQMGLYAFFRNDAGKVATWGYYLYTQTVISDLVPSSPTILSYSELSAIGVIVTIVIFPITLLIRKGLDKFDPNN